MGQVGYYQKVSEKNGPIILFYAFVHTTNGLEFMGSFRHAALLFVHTLVVTHLVRANADSLASHDVVLGSGVTLGPGARG